MPTPDAAKSKETMFDVDVVLLLRPRSYGRDHNGRSAGTPRFSLGKTK